MRTVRQKIYKFDELSKEAQENAIENLSDINTEHEWHDMTTEEETGKLIALGFVNPVIMFSGFSSQGDGACFTSERFEVSRVLNNDKFKDITGVITHNWRHYFATSTTVELEADNEAAEAFLDEAEQAVKDLRESLGNEIYRILEAEYYDLQSEEAIIQTIKANEYEFTQDGKLF